MAAAVPPRRTAARRCVARLLLTLAAAGLPARAGAVAPPIELAAQRLELDGLPVVTRAVDLDGDGLTDLAVVVASTRWGQVDVEQQSAIDASGALAEVLTVVPALFDRRQLCLFHGLPQGGFDPVPVRLELPESVHALEAGAATAPLLALTDDGVDAVRWTADGLALEPLVAVRSLLSGTSSFVPRPRLAHDLDGDGDLDLVVPTEAGLALYLADAHGLAAAPAAVVVPPLEERLPGDARHYRDGLARHVPLPEVRDLDGDGVPDLLLRGHERAFDRTRILFGRGGGRFGPPVDPLAGRSADERADVVFVGDLDGDRRAELVLAEPLESGGHSLRAGLREARRPRFRYSVYRLTAAGLRASAPAASFELEGHVFSGDRDDAPVGTGLIDLDGDGRLDLVAVTLDFSLFEAARVLAARSLRVGFDFALLCQDRGLAFRPVTGLDLAGELRLRLDRLALGQLASFAGDFDGDGRADFLQLGRGRRVTIHRGLPGCRYGARPDALVELTREPLDAALVTVADVDGDGRSDLVITQPGAGDDVGRRAALDLYLSRRGRP